MKTGVEKLVMMGFNIKQKYILLKAWQIMHNDTDLAYQTVPVAKASTLARWFGVTRQQKWQDCSEVTVFGGDFVKVIIKLTFEEVATISMASS